MLPALVNLALPIVNKPMFYRLIQPAAYKLIPRLLLKFLRLVARSQLVMLWLCPARRLTL